jgi:hypothetical protein
MSASVLDNDLYGSICGHDEHFSRVISWISADLYQPKEITDEMLLDENTRYYKHKKMPLAPDRKKAISKKRKADVYGGIGLSSNGDGDEGEGEEGNASDDNGAGKELASSSAAAKGMMNSSPFLTTHGQASAVGKSTLDQLRERLQQRILGLKESRMKKRKKMGDSEEGDENSVDKEKEKEGKGDKKSGLLESHNGVMKDLARVQRNAQYSDEDGDGSMDDSVDGDEEEEGDRGRDDGIDDVGDIAFNDIRGLVSGGVSSTGKGKTKQAGSKMQRLQRMLVEAEKKRQRLDELKKQGKDGQKRAMDEQWSDVLKEVTGEKSGLDVEKVKKAIKKREKSKQKSAEAWRERTEKVTADKNARLDKRDANIAKSNRKGGPAVAIATPAVPDAAAAAAAAKPFGNRGGFEGRKTQLLNGGKNGDGASSKDLTHSNDSKKYDNSSAKKKKKL